MILPTFIGLNLGWSLVRKGYVGWTSRKKAPWPRGIKAHRLVMETLLGDQIDTGFHVHHMDFNKLNNCPFNLVLIDHRLHQDSYQCPWTGQFVSRREAVRRGIIQKRSSNGSN